MKQIIICCPTYKNITKKDLCEIENLLAFKKRLKEKRGLRNDKETTEREEQKE